MPQRARWRALMSLRNPARVVVETENRWVPVFPSGRVRANGEPFAMTSAPPEVSLPFQRRYRELTRVLGVGECAMLVETGVAVACHREATSIVRSGPAVQASASARASRFEEIFEPASDESRIPNLDSRRD